MSKDATIMVRYGTIVLLAVFVIGVGYLLSYHKPVETVPVVADPVSVSSKPTQDRIADVPAPSITRADFQNAFDSVNSAVTDQTDVMFSGPETSDPKLTIKTADPAAAKKIDSLRLDVSKTLDDLHYLLATLPPNITDPTILSRATQDVESIKQYVDELQKIVDDLTTRNSGLTQAEIDAYQATVAAAEADADNAVASIQPSSDPTPPVQGTPPSQPSDSSGSTPDDGVVSPAPSSSAPSSPSPDNGNTDSSAPDVQNDSSGDNVPPPPSVNQPDHSGAPRLIEGANPII